MCAVSYDLVEKSIKELNGLQTVLSFEPSTVEEILGTIIGIGEKTDTEYEANAIVADSFRRINIIKEKINNIDNSPIVLVRHHRNDKTKSYEIEFYPFPENYPGDDDIADAAYMNQQLEKVIRLYPAQYMWTHKRFKTQAGGKPGRF